MINLNEALLIVSDLQKAFKDKPYFNPKIMIFAEKLYFSKYNVIFGRSYF